MISTIKPVRKPDIYVEQMGIETILYNAEGGEIHILNTSAKVVWELCDGTHTLEQIAPALRQHFNVPPTINLRHDIEQILANFADKELLLSPL